MATVQRETVFLRRCPSTLSFHKKNATHDISNAYPPDIRVQSSYICRISFTSRSAYFRNRSRKASRMPKRAKQKRRDEDEYVKAAAWAWYQRSAGAPSKLVREFDAQMPSSTPSRLEATTSPSLHPLRTTPKFSHVLDKSIEMFESEEEEDVNGSSLLDYYEIVELSRRLERSLPLSVKKSGVVGVDNKNVSKASKRAGVKRWWTPAVCSATEVAIPGMGGIGSSKNMFHGLRQRLQQAFVVSPSKTPSHNVRASWTRRNSLDSSLQHPTGDRGSF